LRPTDQFWASQKPKVHEYKWELKSKDVLIKIIKKNLSEIPANYQHTLTSDHSDGDVRHSH